MKKLQTEEWVAIVVTVALGIGIYAYVSGGLGSDVINNKNIETENTDMDIQELKVTTTVEGSGEAAEAGDVVVVNYRGRFASNDKEFDNSYDRGEPFPVLLGQNMVIQGWEQGLLGAQSGETRTLFIPSELAYGSEAITNPQTGEVVIPANSDLIFDVEILDVIPAEELPQS